MSEFQNIIIIGASIAGTQLANALVPIIPGTHRILLIDALDFAFWPPGSVRAATVSGWEKCMTGPLRTSIMFPANSAHTVIAPNKVVELRSSSVVLEKPFEGSTTVAFFVSPIFHSGVSMGSDRATEMYPRYWSAEPSPMRPAPGSTEKEYLNALKKQQSDIIARRVCLSSVLEIRHAYPGKPLTIVHNLPHVLNPTSETPDPTGGHFSYSSPPTAMKLSNNLESELKALDVKLILNDRVEVPTSSTGPKEWDGSFGLQTGPKTVSLKIWEEGRGGLRVHCGWEQAERLACREGGPRGDRGWSHCRRRVSPGESWHPGSGTLQFPLIGTVTTPRFMVKSVKGQKLFTDQLFYGRFKGAEKFEGHPIPAIAA